MRYFIGVNVAGEIRQTMRTQDNYPIEEQQNLNTDLTFIETTELVFKQAYPCPALFKWDPTTEVVIANDLFDRNEVEIPIPDHIEFEDSAPIPDHVTVKRNDGTIIKKGAAVIDIL